MLRDVVGLPYGRPCGFQALFHGRGLTNDLAIPVGEGRHTHIAVPPWANQVRLNRCCVGCMIPDQRPISDPNCAIELQQSKLLEVGSPSEQCQSEAHIVEKAYKTRLVLVHSLREASGRCRDTELGAHNNMRHCVEPHAGMTTKDSSPLTEERG